MLTCFDRDDCQENGDPYPCKDTKGFTLEMFYDGTEFEPLSFRYVKATDDEGNFKDDLDYDYDF